MAKFVPKGDDYRGYGVVDVFEGDILLCTISLHENAVTVQSHQPKGQMELTPNFEWPESVILKWKSVCKVDEKNS